jgi:Yip1 domain
LLAAVLQAVPSVVKLEDRKMSDAVVVAAGDTGPGLSEVERVVDTFVAPTKTFTDILRNSNWWLPFILLVILTLATSFVVDRKVGFTRVAENQVHLSPKQEERFNQLPDDQKAAQLHGMTMGYKVTSYCSFVIILIFVAIAALLYWASFNFGFGSRTTYNQVFALWMYASLPKLITGLLVIVVLLFGGDPESYNVQNPVGTNLGYYFHDTAPWLRAFLSFFDLIGIWSLILLIIGSSIIAKVSRGKAAAVVIGWWLFGLLVSVGMAAAFS